MYTFKASGAPQTWDLQSQSLSHSFWLLSNNDAQIENCRAHTGSLQSTRSVPKGSSFFPFQQYVFASAEMAFPVMEEKSILLSKKTHEIKTKDKTMKETAIKDCFSEIFNFFI